MPPKKKKTKGSKSHIAGGVLQEVTAVFGPGQSIGASFEYKKISLQVVALAAKSIARDEGVTVGMVMTHVNRTEILGMSQAEILELLRGLSGTVRNIRFTALAGSTPAPDPKDQNEAWAIGSSVLEGGSYSPEKQPQSKMSTTAKTRMEALTDLATKSSGAKVADDDWESALHAKPARTTNYSHNGHEVLQPLAKPSAHIMRTQLTVNSYMKAPQAVSGSSTVPKPKMPLIQPPSTGANTAAIAAVATANKKIKQLNPDGSDPFSTPARRRRIVADVSRFLLKQYCQKACKNVLWTRQCTAAAIIVQMAWRRYSARAKLRNLIWLLRNKSALKIQKNIRMFLASCELRRRKAIRLAAQKLRIAILVQAAWRACLDRQRRRKAREAAANRRKRKQHYAAIDIQRVYRGCLARRRFRILYDERERIRLLRYMTALQIQCWYRQRIAIKALIKLRISYLHIAWPALMLHRRLALRMRVCARIIQRIIRGWLARLYAKRLREELEKERLRKLAAEEKIRLETIFQTKVSQLSESVKKSCNLLIELQARVEMKMLRHLAAMGPAETVKWALSTGALHYEEGVGYTIGDTFVQVMGAVEVVCGPHYRHDKSKGAGYGVYMGGETKESIGVIQDTIITIDNDSNNENDHHTAVTPGHALAPRYAKSVFANSATEGKSQELDDAALNTLSHNENEMNIQNKQQRVLYVDHWRQISKASDEPKDDRVPSRWNQVVCVPRTSTMGNGVELFINRDRTSIQINLQFRSLQKYEKEVKVDVMSPITNKCTATINVLPITVIKIVLESIERTPNDDSQALTITPASGIIMKYDANPIQMCHYRTIRVSLPEPELDDDEPEPELENEPSPEPSPDPSPTKSISQESFGSMDDDIDSIPDFDRYACVIQFGYRQHLRKRILAALIIQKIWKRRNIFIQWEIIIEQVMERAIASSECIQRCIRCYIAKCFVNHIRNDVIAKLTLNCDRVAASLVDDMSNFRAFLESEKGNWEAFGMEQPINLQFLEEIATQNEVNDKKYTDTAEFSDASSQELVSAIPKKEKTTNTENKIKTNVPGVILRTSIYTQAQSSTIRSQLLKIVELPEPPTSCVHPLDEMFSTSQSDLCEPWDIYTDTRLGIPVPYSITEREEATKASMVSDAAAPASAALVHSVYNRMASKGIV